MPLVYQSKIYTWQYTGPYTNCAYICYENHVLHFLLKLIWTWLRLIHLIQTAGHNLLFFSPRTGWRSWSESPSCQTLNSWQWWQGFCWRCLQGFPSDLAWSAYPDDHLKIKNLEFMTADWSFFLVLIYIVRLWHKNRYLNGRNVTVSFKYHGSLC